MTYDLLAEFSRIVLGHEGQLVEEDEQRLLETALSSPQYKAKLAEQLSAAFRDRSFSWCAFLRDTSAYDPEDESDARVFAKTHLWDVVCPGETLPE